VPRSRIIVDEDGLGGGVKDILKCKGFIANSRPQKDENYTNLKTQCYYRLAQKINARLISINCQDDKVKQLIIEELEQVKSYKPDDDKKVRILPKDNIKQLIGRSPDFADAMAMRMWEAPKFGFGVDIK
jgi:phage terminase large subunit